MKNPNHAHLAVRVILSVTIELVIAAVHLFRLGNLMKGEWYVWYYSWASDLMIPLGAYFLLSINEIQLPFLRKWYVKVLIVFFVMTFSEIMQIFGIYFFGVTYDPVDIFMFGAGALIAAFLDKQIFERIVPCWRYDIEH